MDIIKPGSRFDFVGKQKPFLIGSVIAVLLSIGLLVGVGLNFGVDFKGGSEIILAFKSDVGSDQVRDAAENLGFAKPDVQAFGDAEEHRFLIRIPSISFLNAESAAKLKTDIEAQLAPIRRFNWSEEGGDTIYIRFQDEAKVDIDKLSELVNKAELGNFKVELQGTDERPEYKLQLQELQGRVAEHMAKSFGAEVFDPTKGVERVETVGPRVGEQLRNSGLLSILLAMLFILIYIAFRFDVRYAPGAVLALFHDILITLGFYAALQIEVSLPIIAALLTIVGYSLNDTIVIFDRIRENFTLLGDKSIEETVNISINDSLSRTLLTSVTTLIAVLALYAFAGDLVRQFAFALIVGVIVGTYSSTFVASPVLIFMHNWMEERRQFKLEQEQRAAEQAEQVEQTP
ncbi:MAG: protein translocase subunit SecF [Myxococcales bacterium]|nr:protein translocase subunit SecF [Myxococcales bacterium]